MDGVAARFLQLGRDVVIVRLKHFAWGCTQSKIAVFRKRGECRHRRADSDRNWVPRVLSFTEQPCQGLLGKIIMFLHSSI